MRCRLGLHALAPELEDGTDGGVEWYDNSSLSECSSLRDEHYQFDALSVGRKNDGQTEGIIHQWKMVSYCRCGISMSAAGRGRVWRPLYWSSS